MTQNSTLPEFDKRRYDQISAYVNRVFSNGSHTGSSTVERLIEYGDGHFRVLFRLDYFTLRNGRTEPSKSQWNTLKKHMKRVDEKVFIFKEHGTHQNDDGTTLYYVDFGFFKH